MNKIATLICKAETFKTPVKDGYIEISGDLMQEITNHNDIKQIYRKQAVQLYEVLAQTLPQGTMDMLLIEMFKNKTSTLIYTNKEQ